MKTRRSGLRASTKIAGSPIANAMSASAVFSETAVPPARNRTTSAPQTAILGDYSLSNNITAPPTAHIAPSIRTCHLSPRATRGFLRRRQRAQRSPTNQGTRVIRVPRHDTSEQRRWKPSADPSDDRPAGTAGDMASSDAIRCFPSQTWGVRLSGPPMKGPSPVCRTRAELLLHRFTYRLG